jgi:hypothetical protein
VCLLLLVASGVAVPTIANAQQQSPAPPRPYHHITLYTGLWLEQIDVPPTPPRFSQQEWVNELTFGLGYEYRTSDNMGLTFLLQRAAGDVDATLLGGGVGIHPSKHLGLLIGSVWESRDSGDSFKIRFGLNWELRAGEQKRTTITPSVTFDMTETELVMLFGMSFGRTF